MTHAELLRNHADLATREGGMYYSGEYLSGIATAAESLELENAKLRELCVQMVETVECYSGTKRCVLFSECAAGGHEPCLYEQKLRELGVEVDDAG